MAIENVSALTKGMTIRFRTLSPHDNVLWAGKITAMCDYDIASTFEDVDTYYQDILKINPAMDAKEALNYIIVSVSENGSVATKRVFALEWLDVSTVEVVTENTHVDIRIYDINSTKTEDVLSAITAMGYVAKVIPSAS